MSNHPTQRPNVIWIFGDQHRAQALGYAGDPNVHTPNIDRLAAEGLTLTAAVGGCPLCSPYRGSLLSGRYPHNSGVPCHQGLLPADQPTIADAFNDAGYRTAYFGKWHVGGFEEGPGLRAGLYVIPPEHRGHFDRLDRLREQQQPVGLLGPRRRGRRRLPISAARLRDRCADRSLHRLFDRAGQAAGIRRWRGQQ